MILVLLPVLPLVPLLVLPSGLDAAERQAEDEGHGQDGEDRFVRRHFDAEAGCSDRSRRPEFGCFRDRPSPHSAHFDWRS